MDMLPPKKHVPKNELKEWAILKIKQQPFYKYIDDFWKIKALLSKEHLEKYGI